MPIVDISLIRGRPPESIDECIRQVARTVAGTLDVPLQTVRVIVREVDREHWAVGDVIKSD
jgi:4-oxalocrotonate tautomerase